MWLVFQFARLVTCVASSVVGLFPANPQCAFPRSNPQIQTRSKTSNKKSPGGTILFFVQNKKSSDVHFFFDQSTLELITLIFLLAECTTGFANYAKTITYFLVVQEKVRGNCSLSERKVCCSCASSHI